MIREAGSREIHGIEFIAGLDAQFAAFEETLKPRLKGEKDLWRQYRIARVATERVIEGLYSTLPVKTLRRMQRLCDCGEVVIRPRPVIPYDDVQIVSTADLRMLINICIAAECAICLKDAREQKKCPLRDALMGVAPPGELREDGECGYRDVARKCEYGKCI